MNLKNLRLSDLSIPCLVKTVLKNLWMVIASALIFAMSVSLFFDLVHTPVYQGSMTYAVTSRRNSYTSSYNTTAAKEVASVLSEMLETSMVRRELQAYSQELSGFGGSISASLIQGTNFVVVTVQDESPEKAFRALQAIDELLPTLTEYVSGNSVVQIIRNPSVGTSPVNKVDVSRYSRMAAILGAAVMAAVLCWMSIERGTVQTRSGARRMLDSPIIAAVHQESPRRTLRNLMKKQNKPLQVFAPTTSFAYTERINTICTRLEHESAVRGSKIFLFTGVGENEGKSTIAANVASSLALMGKKVAIVDCDLRNPSLNKFFGGKYTAPLPLNQLLAQPFSRENLLQCMQPHPKLGLYMLFSLTPDRRCAELLSGTTMDSLLLQLKVFDYVILDTPPMGFFADAELLADKADATVMVVRQDCTPAPDINDAIDVLRGSRASFLGCVLNGMTGSMTEGRGYSKESNRYGYGYHYGYGEKKSAASGKSHRSQKGGA